MLTRSSERIFNPCRYTDDKLSDKSIIVRGNLFGDFFIKVTCCSSRTAEYQLSMGKVCNQDNFIPQLIHYFCTTRVSWIRLKKNLFLLCKNRIIV